MLITLHYITSHYNSFYYIIFITCYSTELEQKESLWDVDGDLFGLDPEHLVPDSFLSFDTFFYTPNDEGKTDKLLSYATAAIAVRDMVFLQ